MTKDEALKLALEGLEEWRFGGDPRAADKYITAIKEVLAQSTSGDYAVGYSIGFGDGHSAREALAQPEQTNIARHEANVQKFLGDSQPKQELVALPCCGYADASAIKWNPHNQVVQCHNCGQIYTTPPQRTWVELTENEIEELFQSAAGADEGTVFRFAAALQARLKELNT